MGPNYIDSHWLFTDVIMQTLWVHGPSSKNEKEEKKEEESETKIDTTLLVVGLLEIT